MTTQRPTKPIVAPGLIPLAATAFAVVLSVVGGGYLSRVFAGTGGALPSGMYGVFDVFTRLFLHPADPALAWPEGSRPGGPVLTWGARDRGGLSSLPTLTAAPSQYRAAESAASMSVLTMDQALAMIDSGRASAEDPSDDFTAIDIDGARWEFDDDTETYLPVE